MADIRNSISLQDRMTPVFKSIINSMDRTMKVMRTLDKQANNGVQSRAYKAAQRAINQANNEITRMKNGLDQADKAAKRLEKTTQNVKNNTSRMSGGGFNLVNLSAALYLFKNIEQAVSSIMNKVDSAISTQARLGLFNESPYSKEQLYGATYQTALNTRTGLEETGNLATRILISDSMQGPGAALGSLKVAGIINKAAIAGGGTAEENRRALLQLSQSLASGVMQGDELRAIREQTPYLMSVIAKGLGKVDPKKFANISMGDLKKLGAEGELTSERIIKAFLAMEGDVDKAFNLMPRTFGQAMTQLGSIWQYFLYMLYQGDGALAKITQKAWQFADYLSSPEGEKTLQKVAAAFSVVVNVVLMLVDALGGLFQFLMNHTDIMIAALTALGVVLLVVAVQALVAWIAAAWPFLLIAAIIGIIVYALLKMGFTFDQIIGGLIGGITWFVGLLWQVCLWFGNVGLAAWAIIKNIGLWFANLGLGIWNVLSACWYNVESAFINTWKNIQINFNNFIKNVLTGVDLIIGALNKIPGVNINTSGLESTINSYARTSAELEASKRGYKDIGNEWNKGYNTYAYDDVGKAYSTFNAFGDGWSKQWFDPGYKAGSDFVKSMKGADFTMGMSSLKDMDALLKGWDPNSVTMNGGHLDSVGKVDISDEDLQLLKDISAKEFLLSMKQITPQANIKFGDVRETADVHKIMEAIETMVEEAMATHLVAD